LTNDKTAEKVSLAFCSQGYAVDQLGTLVCEPNVYIAAQLWGIHM